MTLRKALKRILSDGGEIRRADSDGLTLLPHASAAYTLTARELLADDWEVVGAEPKPPKEEKPAPGVREVCEVFGALPRRQHRVSVEDDPYLYTQSDIGTAVAAERARCNEIACEVEREFGNSAQGYAANRIRRLITGEIE